MLRNPTPAACGQLLLEVIPRVMQSLRMQLRGQRLCELSVPQFRVLAFVSRHAGASLSDAAIHVGLGKPSMSALVETLVRRNLLTRVTSAHDRRRLTLALSAQGDALLARTRAATLALLDVRLAALKTVELETLVKALDLLRPLFRDPEPLPSTPPPRRRRAGRLQPLS